MAKKLYVGVNGIARQVNNMYVGVNGVARKVIKGYVGVGGVARPFWTGGQPTYFGKAENLSVNRTNMTSNSIGNYVVFAGGGTVGYGTYNTVDAYNNNLVHTIPTPLTTDRTNVMSGNTGNYILFAGGSSREYGILTEVDAYNSSLSKTQATNLSNQPYAGGNVSSYALFPNMSSTDTYNTSLTRTQSQKLSLPSSGLTNSSMSNYSLFGGGSAESDNSIVQAYNSSLTLQTIDPLYQGRQCIGTTLNTYFLFAGGRWSSGETANVDVYDSSLTKVSQSVSCGKINQFGVGALENYTFFAGGYNNNIETTVLDSSLVLSNVENLSQGRTFLTGGVINNYALFAGGTVSSNTYSYNVDVYMV